jgi:hypothetical protein
VNGSSCPVRQTRTELVSEKEESTRTRQTSLARLLPKPAAYISTHSMYAAQVERSMESLFVQTKSTERM